MARGKFISAFERDVIRIGVHNGQSCARIGEFLGRTRMAIHNHIKAMEREGSLENLPLDFVQEDIARALENE